MLPQGQSSHDDLYFQFFIKTSTVMKTNRQDYTLLCKGNLKLIIVDYQNCWVGEHILKTMINTVNMPPMLTSPVSSLAASSLCLLHHILIIPRDWQLNFDQSAGTQYILFPWVNLGKCYLVVILGLLSIINFFKISNTF